MKLTSYIVPAAMLAGMFIEAGVARAIEHGTAPVAFAEITLKGGH